MPSSSPASPRTVVELDHLRVARGGEKVIRDASLRVAEGDLVAVVGANGVGKTTLLRALLGLIPAQWDGFRVQGMAVNDQRSFRRVRRSLAWVPQGIMLGEFPVTGDELFGAGNVRAQARGIAASLGAARILTTPLRELSGGQRQRVLLARALGQVTAQSAVLLADEPSTGLDAGTINDLVALLSGSTVSGVIVTHDDRLVGACNRQLELVDGRLMPA